MCITIYIYVCVYVFIDVCLYVYVQTFDIYASLLTFASSIHIQMSFLNGVQIHTNPR